MALSRPRRRSVTGTGYFDLKLGFNLELDYEFIVKFMMKMKENRRLFSLNQAFEETAKVFKMTPEETERKYVELKDLI